MNLSNMFTIKEFTGKHMIAVMVLFFGTIITANMTLTWFALGSWSGLVAKNGYVASIEFNDREAAVQAQSELGWKSKLRLDRGHLIFAIKDKSGKAVSGLKIVAVIGRPTTEVSDMALLFHEGNAGEYLATAPKKSGQWQVSIKAVDSKNQTYNKFYKVLVKDQE